MKRSKSKLDFMVLCAVLVASTTCFEKRVGKDAIKNVNNSKTSKGKGSPQFLLDKAKKYLKDFGYLASFDVKEANVTESLFNFQYFANLPETGKLDEATIKQMAVPRCGLEDPYKKVRGSRTRRYVHQGTTWKKNLLTWRLFGRGETLDNETIRTVMRQATELWTVHTNIDFKEIIVGIPDIEVKFVKQVHGDPYAFDGRGGTLAHAFYPHLNKGLAGDVHFDDEEYYTYQSAEGRNLLWVATHELGHSLGLEHSNVREAVMYPWYSKYQPGFKLNYDDVLGIQTLYGSRIKPETTTTTTTQSTTASTTTTKATTTIPPTITTGITTTKATTTVSLATAASTTTTKATTIVPPTMTVNTTTVKAATTTPSATIISSATTKATTTVPPTTVSSTTTTKAITAAQTTTTTSTTTTKTSTTFPPTTTASTTTAKATTIIPPTTTVSIATTKATTLTLLTVQTEPTRPTRPTIKRPIRYKKCPGSTITGVYYNTFARLTVIFTKSGKMYFLKKVGGRRYGPIVIKKYFQSFQIQGPLDAAFDIVGLNKWIPKRHQTIFFSGEHYYVYHHFKQKSGPHSIHGNNRNDVNPLKLVFPPWVSKIDAVLTWHRNKKTYFFSGKYYWRYNNQAKKFDLGYPKEISSGWKGLPKEIDAAFSLDLEQITYFVSGNQFYLLDDYYVRVKQGYPKHIGDDWLNCRGMETNDPLTGAEIIVGTEKGSDP